VSRCVLSSHDFADEVLLTCSYRQHFLRDIRDFFDTTFNIAPVDRLDPENKDLLYSCYGVGYSNANRTVA
jgi:hypothetical protein